MTIPEDTSGSPKELNIQNEQNEIIGLAVQAKHVRQTTLILIGAIAIVLAAIWLIHKKNSPAQANAAVVDQQLVIENAITQLTGIKTENVGQVDQLVKKFYEFADFGQVAADQLRENPFNPAQALSDAAKDSFVSKENSGENKIQNEAKKLQLQSILQSKYGSCCMIDDTLLYKGDKIGNFEVIEIGDGFVRLRSSGQDAILYLQTE
ncbi:MAG: hypothetical protein ABSE89_02700 [Sedimentisphaerales bacterium]